MKTKKARVRGRGTLEDCVKIGSKAKTRVVDGHLLRWVGIGWVDEGPAPARVVVFAPDYRPFIMGGDVHQPMAAEVDATGPFPLGKGFEGYLVVAPTGKTHVAEKSTGALVGDSLENVRADIKKGKKTEMTAQVAQAAEMAKRARRINADEFWERMKGRKS